MKKEDEHKEKDNSSSDDLEFEEKLENCEEQEDDEVWIKFIKKLLWNNLLPENL